MSVLKYFKNTLRSPPIGRQALSVNFFFQIRNEVPGKKRPCRPPNGRQAPVALGVGDSPLSPPQRATGPFFFSRDFVANLKEKKLHFGPVALWEGDRGIFLKFFKTDIYF